MSAGPVISVLIPTYNYARYLPETLDSVLAQDAPSVEIIITDDASTDDSESICRDYARRDPRISYIRHEQNIGMVRNWNDALGRARGRYVKFLLADDKLNRPSALSIMAARLEQHPGASMAACARSIIDEASREIEVVYGLGPKDRVLTMDWMVSRFLDRDAKHINSIGEPSAVMFRREAGARGFDLAFRQLVDLEMWFHLLGHGPLIYLAEPLCCFRRHDAQQTRVNQRACVHQHEEVALCRLYSHANKMKGVLFSKMYRFRKDGRPEYRELIQSIRREFTDAEYTRYYMRYKASKPFRNIGRSIGKRLGRPPADGEAPT